MVDISRTRFDWVRVTESRICACVPLQLFFRRQALYIGSFNSPLVWFHRRAQHRCHHSYFVCKCASCDGITRRRGRLSNGSLSGASTSTTTKSKPKSSPKDRASTDREIKIKICIRVRPILPSDQKKHNHNHNNSNKLPPVQGRRATM